MNKDELRKIYLAKRLALTDEVYHALSLKISDLFFKSVNLAQVKTVHIYLPIEKKREVDTWLIINRIQREFSSVRLIIPRVIDEDMENIVFESTDQLKKNSWGILEPTYGIKVEAREIDIVIVPLLVIDKQGHRIGYGKGYYDRFLSMCRPDCHKIGISFFEPEEIIRDRSVIDITLNACITSTGMVYF